MCPEQTKFCSLSLELGGEGPTNLSWLVFACAVLSKYLLIFSPDVIIQERASIKSHVVVVVVVVVGVC